MDLLVAAVIFWIVPIFVAYGQGKAKNRLGLAYGIFLGWIGVICLAALPALPDEDEEPPARRVRRVKTH